MDTKITKSNVKSAIKDDKAHIDYLKRDVLDDQKYGGKNEQYQGLHRISQFKTD